MKLFAKFCLIGLFSVVFFGLGSGQRPCRDRLGAGERR